MQDREDADYFGKSKYVTELKPKDFESTAASQLKSKECAAVLFYAPWCPHCKAVKDEWEKFAQSSGHIDVFAFNCEKNKGHLLKIREELPELVRGFPTIIYYKNGKPSSQHQGNRETGNFLKASMALCKSQ